MNLIMMPGAPATKQATDMTSRARDSTIIRGESWEPGPGSCSTAHITSSSEEKSSGQGPLRASAAGAADSKRTVFLCTAANDCVGVVSVVTGAACEVGVATPRFSRSSFSSGQSLNQCLPSPQAVQSGGSFTLSLSLSPLSPPLPRGFPPLGLPPLGFPPPFVSAAAAAAALSSVFGA